MMQNLRIFFRQAFFKHTLFCHSFKRLTCSFHSVACAGMHLLCCTSFHLGEGQKVLEIMLTMILFTGVSVWPLISDLCLVVMRWYKYLFKIYPVSFPCCLFQVHMSCHASLKPRLLSDTYLFLYSRLIEIDSADEFYSTMGQLCNQMLKGNIIEGDELIQVIIRLFFFCFSLKGLGTFCTTQNTNFHRCTFNLHSLKIMVVESFP